MKRSISEGFDVSSNIKTPRYATQGMLLNQGPSGISRGLSNTIQDRGTFIPLTLTANYELLKHNIFGDGREYYNKFVTGSMVFSIRIPKNKLIDGIYEIVGLEFTTMQLFLEHCHFKNKYTVDKINEELSNNEKIKDEDLYSYYSTLLDGEVSEEKKEKLINSITKKKYDAIKKHENYYYLFVNPRLCLLCTSFLGVVLSSSNEINSYGKNFFFTNSIKVDDNIKSRDLTQISVAKMGKLMYMKNVFSLYPYVGDKKKEDIMKKLEKLEKLGDINELKEEKKSDYNEILDYIFEIGLINKLFLTVNDPEYQLKKILDIENNHMKDLKYEKPINGENIYIRLLKKGDKKLEMSLVSSFDKLSDNYINLKKFGIFMDFYIFVGTYHDIVEPEYGEIGEESDFYPLKENEKGEYEANESVENYNKRMEHNKHSGGMFIYLGY